jgi:plasmid maintenance system antidote protein VapI
MNTTQKYLTQLSAKHGAASGHKMASILGISKQSVSRYVNGQHQMNDEITTKMAIELGLDPVKVYIEVQTEMAKSLESRQIWQRISELSNTAAIVAVVGFAAVMPWGFGGLFFA